MLKRSVKKTTNEQFELLKFEMSLHPAVAIGYGVGTDRGKVDAEWKEIVEKLNAIGPPHRTVTEWKKVWSDVRLRVKKRLSEEFSGKIRKNRKIKDESESEEDFLMESLNNTNSIYASHPGPDNRNYDIPEIVPEPSPQSSVNEPHEQYTASQHDDEDYTQSAATVGNSSVEEEDTNHRTVKKTTSQQFEVLKYEMSKHPAAAMGYGVGTDRSKVDADWREIIVKLNDLGPPYRTVTEWKKVWSDVRLRIKKRIGEKCTRKNRKRKRESESEEDLLMEALNSSIYSSRSCPENEDYDENEIDHDTCPSIINVPIKDDEYNVVPRAIENLQQSATVVENNPLEERELPDVDSKTHLHRNFAALQQPDSVENNPLEDVKLPAIDGSKQSHSNLVISDVAESQYNINRNSFMEHTLYALQSQIEQHNKLLQHLTSVSASVTGLLERQVAIMERRTQLMERQAKTAEHHDYLRRRQETRKKFRGKIFEWF